MTAKCFFFIIVITLVSIIYTTKLLLTSKRFNQNLLKLYVSIEIKYRGIAFY